MIKYTSNSEFNSTLTYDKLLEALEKIEPKIWKNKDLDEFMNGHNDIENVVLFSCYKGFKDIDYIHTKYGKLRIVYTSYLPVESDDKIYLVRMPKIGYMHQLSL